MVNSFSYQTSNTNTQMIDSFDVASLYTVKYDIVEVSNNQNETKFVVNNDGFNSFEYQTSISQTNTKPSEFTSNVYGSSCRIYVTPQHINTKYIITKEIFACSEYAEHTLSGKNILSNTGFCLFNTSNNITIRSNDSEFTFSNSYLISNTLGPIETDNELLISEWNSYNYNHFESINDYNTFVSSGQLKNCNYQQINTTIGELYRFSCAGYYTFDEVLSKDIENQFNGNPGISIGNSISGDELGSVNLTTNNQNLIIDFVAENEITFINIGYGELGVTVIANDISTKKLVPHHTFNNNSGVFYFKWNAVTSPSTIATLSNSNNNITLEIDNSNNIFFNSINCGSQEAVNRICFKYFHNENTIEVFKSGSLILISNSQLNIPIESISISNNLDVYSYMTSDISNERLEVLTHV